MKKIIHFFVYKPLVANLVFIFLFLAGMISVLSMKREAFPRVNFRQVRVLTVYPGASPVDVEKKVTIPIEEKLREVEGLDSVRSISRNSESDISIKIDLEHNNPDGVVNDIRRAVDRVTNLPIQVKDRPIVTEQKSSNFPVLEMAIHGAMNEMELQEMGRFIEDEMRKVSGVSRVDAFGKRKEEWRIRVDPELKKRYTLGFSDIINAISKRNISVPAGSFLRPITQDIRVTGEINEINDIKNIPIRSNETGNTILLSQVANVKDTYERPRVIAIVNGEPAYVLQIIKKDSADIIRTVEAIQERINELRKQIPANIQFTELNNEGARAIKRLDVVITNSLQGLFLVVVVLILFFSLKDALLTSLSLPLTLFATTIAFPIFDVSFNLVSMLGIIISLGMLVDNSIIISENIYKHRSRKMDSKEAAVLGASELFVPIIGSYLTTVAAFLPMAFMSGIMGKFIWQIPFMVIVALTLSLFESFLLLPVRYAQFTSHEVKKRSKHRDKFRSILDNGFESLKSAFTRFITRVVKRPFIALGSILIVFLSSCGLVGLMNFNLFPKEGIDYVLVRAEFPPDFSSQETAKQLQYFQPILDKIPKDEVQSIILKIGIQQTDPTDPLTRIGEQLGMAQIILVPETERKRTAQEIFGELEPDLKKLPNAVSVMVDLVVNGPPIGAAVTVAIEGRDYKILKQISNEMQDFLRKQEGVININDDYKPGREEIQIRVKDTASAITGIDTEITAYYVRTAMEGLEASNLRKGKDEVKIVIQNDDRFRDGLEDLDSIQISNKFGLLTPITAVTTKTTVQGIEALYHNDYEKAITVLADVNEAITSSSIVNGKIVDEFGNIGKKYPGYKIKFRGEQEETAKSMVSLLVAGVLAFFGIFAILAIIFNSIKKPILILLSIPLGFVGVVFGFLISGKALSFLAMIGIIGLAGVIVNASIVLVDTIQEFQAKGEGLYESLITASSERFRPILVTTLTTMAGMIPTAYAIGGSDPLLIPMTLSLAWGLGFGTFGSLLFIPASFSAYYKLKKRS
ncbi:efflux RND transporter permease subunit [Leptospira sp. 2 VSF19]|uniref:Efflux RND transporter permease subunit n=1 Tax=Leptospira soteropolitanensis TaxID=2950025 RepID=A0AAW5V8Y1_9LEPT|nr:efflux RND transporter permease subunit [Leptospira soteropolitanensis]MCW7491820.1 efflux RND transporter permease subunit [Leptospira soteropolitanensis]MCW7499404.1 efflux RND transporter permease subunit [Leptospira soteropolitanensis]MCW7521005.1 efflux RND transporter permease subunit [Leptospira soteropolitanensis]MCW7525508.1 efflux RND transporter permease subunit [Leptospira soteropolitanensis]MCW7529374.1 efflux RND transporter permease subunit [Leptospira soteropolitanensis]